MKEQGERNTLVMSVRWESCNIVSRCGRYDARGCVRVCVREYACMMLRSKGGGKVASSHAWGRVMINAE